MNEQEPITLKEFLKKNESELVDNLYQIFISGKLTFEQTLLYSKLVTCKKITEKYIKNQNQEIEKETSAGDFVLLQSELINCLITSDILRILKAVCTTKELEEIMNCRVLTATWYKRGNEVDKTKFYKIMSNKKKCDVVLFSEQLEFTIDSRIRSWYRIGLDKLVNPLLQKRKLLKKEIELTDKIDLKNQLNAEQNSIKKIVNSIYGIFIVARARADIWLLSRV